MSKEFNVNKVYTNILTKKELIKVIQKCYDKEFIVSYLPRTETEADILIRSRVTEKKSKYPKLKYRLFNRIYAFINGFFWLPCMLCGKYSGGHEWKHDCRIYKGADTWSGVCQECFEVVEERKKK